MQFELNHPRTIDVDGKTYPVRHRGSRFVAPLNNARNPIEAYGYNFVELTEQIRKEEAKLEEKRKEDRRKRQAKAQRVADAPEASVQALWRPRDRKHNKASHVEEVTVRGWDLSAVKKMNLLITTRTGEKLSVPPNSVLALDADTDRLFALEEESDQIQNRLQALENTVRPVLADLLRVPVAITYDALSDKWIADFHDRHFEADKSEDIQNKIVAVAVAETLPWGIEPYSYDEKLMRVEDMDRIFEHTKAWASQEEGEEFVRLTARQKEIWQETRRIERFFDFDAAVGNKDEED